MNLLSCAFGILLQQMELQIQDQENQPLLPEVWVCSMFEMACSVDGKGYLKITQQHSMNTIGHSRQQGQKP